VPGLYEWRWSGSMSSSFTLETVNGFSFCRFFGLFEQIFVSFVGGYINFRILPPTKETKICQKFSKKRRNLNPLTVSKGRVFQNSDWREFEAPANHAKSQALRPGFTGKRYKILLLRICIFQQVILTKMDKLGN